ncbi:MAG: hypothetical protein M3Y59_03040 [Myxococcota bacterium]|nr:hypothetical protein [Myxococcota bacterium]
MSKSEKESELTSAASAVDEELLKFEELSERIRTAEMDSQKSLERFAGSLRDVADADERLGQKVRVLVTAIATARERQQKQAEMISNRAKELQARTQVFQGLIEQYAVLGTKAAELNQAVQQAYQSRQEGTAEGEATATVQLSEINEGTGRLAEEAEKVVTAADEAGFSDISRQADSLRQQLLSARNKLNLLSKKVPTA